MLDVELDLVEGFAARAEEDFDLFDQVIAVVVAVVFAKEICIGEWTVHLFPELGLFHEGGEEVVELLALLEYVDLVVSQQASDV